jgi:hypothetical protein
MNPMNMKTIIYRHRHGIGQHFLVSTVYANFSPPGFETMVFKCKPDGDVTDWGEVAGERYDSEQQARDGHHRMCSVFEMQ